MLLRLGCSGKERRRGAHARCTEEQKTRRERSERFGRENRSHTHLESTFSSPKPPKKGFAHHFTSVTARTFRDYEKAWPSSRLSWMSLLFWASGWRVMPRSSSPVWLLCTARAPPVRARRPAAGVGARSGHSLHLLRGLAGACDAQQDVEQHAQYHAAEKAEERERHGVEVRK